MKTPEILGILNITEDSFSDGGKYLDPENAKNHALELHRAGAGIIDIGASSSNPNADPVKPEIELRRMRPVFDLLREKKVPISVDTFQPEVQRQLLREKIDYLNDIQGFPHPEIYPELAESQVRLIVMHSVQEKGIADRRAIPPDEIPERIFRFFEERIAQLTQAGISEERLILDPGMGFFLSSDAEASVKVLQMIPELKRRFGLPLLISVSRKSFLRKITGCNTENITPANAMAEVMAVLYGSDFIRTHDPLALNSCLRIFDKLAPESIGSEFYKTNS